MKWGLLLALGLPLCACKTTHSSESEVKGAVRVVESRDEGEWSVKTWEYAPTIGGGAPEPDDGMAEVPKQRGRAVTQGVGSDAGSGPLIKYSVETHSPSRSRVEANATAESQTQSASSFAPGGCLGLGLGGVLGFGLLLGGLYLYRRYKP